MPNWITSTITEGQETVLRRLCHRANPINSHKRPIRIGEVGCYTGKSTAVFADFVKRDMGSHYAIDWFRGSEGTGLKNSIYGFDLFMIFIINMREMGLDDSVNLMYMDSESANNLIKDEYFDLFFIDADHRYNGIKKDIDIWLPKIRKGGVICGHDHEVQWNNLTEDEKKYANENLDLDLIQYRNSHMHHGIVKAVGEKFNSVHMEEGLWWTDV